MWCARDIPIGSGQNKLIVISQPPWFLNTFYSLETFLACPRYRRFTVEQFNDSTPNRLHPALAKQSSHHSRTEQSTISIQSVYTTFQNYILNLSQHFTLVQFLSRCFRPGSRCHTPFRMIAR